MNRTSRPPGAISEGELRRGIYRVAVMAVFLPPFLGGTLMGAMGYYPMPEFYGIFLYPSPTVIYVLTVATLLLWQTPRAVRFVLSLPARPGGEGVDSTRHPLARLLPMTLGAVTVYCCFGAVSANFAMEQMGLHAPYTLREHLYNVAGIVPAALVTIFPIYFYLTDLLGRYLAPRGVVVAVAPLRTKLMVLGLFTPLLVDTVLLSYFANRVGGVTGEVVLVWVGLLLMAGIGTWLAWRSVQQGLRPYRDYLAPTSRDENRSQGLMPCSLDELGRLTAELAARLERERWLRVILEAAPDLIAIAAPDGRLEYMNPGGRRMFGLGPEEDITRTRIPDYHEPEVAARILKEVVPVALERGFWEGETRFRRRDGSSFEGSQVIMVHRNPGGEVAQISTITRDLTELRLADEALRGSEARFRSLFGSSPLGLSFYGADGVLVEANNASLRILGLDRLPSEPEPAARLFPNPNIPEAEVERLRQGGVVRLETRVTAAGTARELSAVIVPVGAENGQQVRGYFLILEDVTDRKLAEERLRRALAEKEVLLKEIYHRVKNNLQVVASLLAMQGRTVEDEGFRALLVESANRVKSMALVHEQLYRSGNLARIALQEYVERLAEQLAAGHHPRSQQIPIRVEVEPVQLGIEMAVPCGLILTELVSNVYKHAYAEGGRGEVTVTVSRAAEGRVRIRVADGGRGLPPDFEPGQNTTLGMRLVVTLVEQLEGRLTHGAGSGGGAWFEFSFVPDAAPADAHAA